MVQGLSAPKERLLSSVVGAFVGVFNIYPKRRDVVKNSRQFVARRDAVILPLERVENECG